MCTCTCTFSYIYCTPAHIVVLHHQGFVPALNDVYTSETIIPAAFAAIDDINANCSILPGYYLELEFVNTKVSLVHVGHCFMFHVPEYYVHVHVFACERASVKVFLHCMCTFPSLSSV